MRASIVYGPLGLHVSSICRVFTCKDIILMAHREAGHTSRPLRPCVFMCEEGECGWPVVAPLPAHLLLSRGSYPLPSPPSHHLLLAPHMVTSRQMCLCSVLSDFCYDTTTMQLPLDKTTMQLPLHTTITPTTTRYNYHATTIRYNYHATATRYNYHATTTKYNYHATTTRYNYHAQPLDTTTMQLPINRGIWS